MFRILSIDGGGVRGIVPAHILTRVAEKINPRFLDDIDMLAGTSTGSIIAAGLACGIDPKEILKLYVDNCAKIFSPKRPYWLRTCEQTFRSLYSKKPLEEALKDIFEDRKLGEITIPLIIPATDLTNGCVHVFKSAYDKEFVRDKEILVWEAVMASCSAPTYFRPSMVDGYQLTDGGIWANNPSLSAVIDAKRRLSISLDQILILSLGTGHVKKYFRSRPTGQWGLFSGWKGFAGFLEFQLSLQSQSTHNYLRLLLNEEQVLRIDVDPDFPIPNIDDPNNLQDLMAHADKQFSHKVNLISKFLNSNSGGNDVTSTSAK